MADSLAEERIRTLFEVAERRLDEEECLADRYIEIARKISMKTETSIPQKLSKKYCQECGIFFKPGNRCKIRLDSSRQNLVYRCTECGGEKRYGY